MSQRSKRSIFIVNAPPDGNPFTNRRSATRMIARGRAAKIDDYNIELVEKAIAPAMPTPREIHSPRIFISTEKSLASGRYRNDVLGLPNFCGIQPGRRNAGRIVEAA